MLGWHTLTRIPSFRTGRVHHPVSLDSAKAAPCPARAYMLHDFIRSHRAEILQRARLRVAERRAPLPTAEELENGIPLFLEELIEMLASRDLHPSSAASAATRHGHNRFAMGFTIAQVVHDYGDVCQVVTELAIESKAALSTEDFRALNGCLDDAIA